ncbi:Hypothetical protein FKW44_018655 [Caligus rogercresseyi]|uniref:Uncharacterized protein n=1 Tax=Caligus rogercresseyi TaxID=217165 RepID=A0A7T8JXV7_CALRO|nr:Hypothetical protein FKW44_018655 [Caligus rogercresseyi]
MYSQSFGDRPSELSQTLHRRYKAKRAMLALTPTKIVWSPTALKGLENSIGLGSVIFKVTGDPTKFQPSYQSKGN